MKFGQIKRYNQKFLKVKNKDANHVRFERAKKAMQKNFLR